MILAGFAAADYRNIIIDVHRDLLELNDTVAQRVP